MTFLFILDVMIITTKRFKDSQQIKTVRKQQQQQQNLYRPL